MVKPFKVNISDQVLEAIYAKVKDYPWHEMPDDGGWGVRYKLILHERNF